MKNNDSAFNLGIIAAKEGKKVEDNPFDISKEKTKYDWWKEGHEAANHEKYADKHGYMLKDKEIYESG